MPPTTPPTMAPMGILDFDCVVESSSLWLLPSSVMGEEEGREGTPLETI